MSSSGNKTLGVVIVILFIFLILYSLSPFLFGPFHSMTRVLFPMPFNPLFEDGGWLFSGMFRFMPLLMLIIWIGVTIWVYRDAEDRRMSGLLWALLVFVGNIIGLIIYLIIRNGSVASTEAVTTLVSCPSCEARITERFTFCPHCGEKLKKTCNACDKPLLPEWKVCPHCGEKTS